MSVWFLETYLADEGLVLGQIMWLSVGPVLAVTLCKVTFNQLSPKGCEEFPWGWQ